VKQLSRRTFVQIASVGCVMCSARDPRFLGSTTETNLDSLASLSLAEASRLVAAREITATELTTACLERTTTYNPKLNAFISVMREEALARAAQLDKEALTGKIRGPLHGIPIAIKDNIDTAGTATTAASEALKDRIPVADAEVIRRLKEAGAVILGKTNLQEFAMGDSSATSYFGPVHNPWALDRIPGGSSGGSAAAVISNLSFGALGTDTGGSIRMPAAYCGVVGLKPTYGLVSLRGIIPLIYSLDHCGPIARTVEDTAILLNAIAGYDKQDVASVQSGQQDYVEALKQSVSTIRLGTLRDPFFEKLDAEISKAVEQALTILAKLTLNIRDIVLPDWSRITKTSLDGEIEAFHQELFRKGEMLYSLPQRNRLKSLQTKMDDTSTQGCSTKIVDYVRARWELDGLRKSIDDIFAQVDVLVLPTERIMPRTIAEALNRERHPGGNKLEDTSNDFAFNVFGIPAISIPCGFSSQGLPIGLTMAAAKFSEGTLLRLANAYEKATAWYRFKPPLSGGT
jgi:aspartyl-tRNA(Asn)/glutamyl-tRNA(Gln) amidotransferase subunit A